MVRLTSVISFGVMRVPTSRRVIASEMRRSTWRDMNPSVSLMRLRSSQSSAAWAPAAPPSAKRPAGSPASVARARRRESAVIRSSAPAAWPAERSTSSIPALSTTAVSDESTASVSGSSGISRRARSQRAWGRTFAGTRTSRARGATGVSASSRLAAVPASRRGSGQARGWTRTRSKPARSAARTMRRTSGRPAITVPGGGEPAPGGAGRITRRLRTETAVEESVVTRPTRPARPGGASRRRGGSTRGRRTPPRCTLPPRPDCGCSGPGRAHGR